MPIAATTTDGGVDKARRTANAYGMPLTEFDIERLDVPEVLKTAVALTYAAPGIYRLNGLTYVVGDPAIDAEISTSWVEADGAVGALEVRPGVLEFRRRVPGAGEAEPPQVERLPFRRMLDPRGQDLVDFAAAADL